MKATQKQMLKEWFGDDLDKLPDKTKGKKGRFTDDEKEAIAFAATKFTYKKVAEEVRKKTGKAISDSYVARLYSDYYGEGGKKKAVPRQGGKQ